MLRSYYNIDAIEAGLDEAGRGCLAGPVVAAAVILPKDYTHEWLNDSKQLSHEQRVKLRTEIERDAIAFAVAEASNEEIDQINILKASFLAMHRAVEKLSFRPEHLLIDGNRFTPYPLIPHTCIVKGDAKFLSIAAASILAKTYRDDLMGQFAKKYPYYRWEQNAGYPTPFHKKAIKEHGFTPLHRLTFKSE
ncbi:ribonuclease HII/HIII [Emticicia oligotrophica DSM 17448]|jgi:ribonuclease HII|uniref:Ribonuclease HII n=1 Tax=Emticicia oligotrophica (strain DSM 17448 / CIP 109782 / MTCC 6937 / GPTSA100-15) TaxID=929562 RepID=A0ABM5N0D1_EMTOG|nr:ribonuclease HII [Emticicia oligotrophica]AFK02892.1 ribonuclease HII/HIII [Emticicia oligotrophica DSM 17448]